MKNISAIPTIQLDNEFVKVTKWFFPPNSETGMHIHEMDYVIVPITSGALTIENPDNTYSKSELKKGESYSRTKGVHHNVMNKNNFDFAFIEIEIKKK